MVSEPLSVTARDIMAPGPASPSESGRGTVLLPTGMKEGAEPEGVDLRAITEEVHTKITRVQNVDLRFSIHEGSGRIVVTVVDEATGEVIREIPPAEVLNLAVRLDEMIGLLFDQMG